MSSFSRRRVLRGMLNGGAVTVGLPFLNYFLNGNGNALASGAPIPVRFGTWFWGCGITPHMFEPKKVGADFDLPEEIAPLEAVRKHINIFTNFNAFRDSAPNSVHFTGWAIARSGTAPTGGNFPGESIDVTIANKIGRSTRFRTLTASATGDVRNTLSYENANSPNAAEGSPVNMYTRLFGPDFQDPNAPTFTPSPRTMMRKSVLSVMKDQTESLAQRVGAEDKARLDQYFTGLRELERQLDQQLTKPEPIASCKPMGAIKGAVKTSSDTEATMARHKLLTDLMVMAVACDQTRVINMAYSTGLSNTTKLGYEKPHHTATHEELIDEKLTYQPNVSWFTRRAMDNWAYYVDAFAKIKEGDGTLLDNSLLMANTDHSFARAHSIDGVPAFTAGRAGGLMKTGIHVKGSEGTLVRVSYTALRVMGVDVAAYGTKSNRTSDAIGEVLA